MELNDFVGSVDKRNLRTVVHGSAPCSTTPAAAAAAARQRQHLRPHRVRPHRQTIRLLDRGERVLSTQQGEREHPTLARDLGSPTDALASSDDDLQQVLADTRAPPARSTLLKDLEPTLPVLLGNAVSVNQVVVSNLAGVESSCW